MKYVPPARIYKLLQDEQGQTGKSLQTLITLALEDYYKISSNSKTIRSQEYEETNTKIYSDTN